jgi:hypothetical protein
MYISDFAMSCVNRSCSIVIAKNQNVNESGMLGGTSLNNLGSWFHLWSTWVSGLHSTKRESYKFGTNESVAHVWPDVFFLQFSLVNSYCVDRVESDSLKSALQK